MALRAIIFDVDGTLANTERDGHRPAFNAAFAEMGLSWHWDESFYGTLLVKGGGLERLYFYAEHFDPATRARSDFEDLMQRVHDIKTRNYQRLLAAGAIPLRADIGQLICDARTEDVRLGIASSSKLENIVGLFVNNLVVRCNLAENISINTADAAPIAAKNAPTDLPVMMQNITIVPIRNNMI